MDCSQKDQRPASDSQTRQDTKAAFKSMTPMKQRVSNEMSINRGRKKSAMSYVALISRAILASPNEKLTLSEIYQFIEKHFPDFVNCRVGWKNTVRHNLSLHDCFIKGELSQHGKSCYWRIHPRYVSRFVLGDFRRQTIRGENETNAIFPAKLKSETATDVKIGNFHNPEENSTLFAGQNFPTCSPPVFNHYQFAVLPQLSFRYAPFLRFIARDCLPFCANKELQRGNQLYNSSSGHRATFSLDPRVAEQAVSKQRSFVSET